MPKCIRAIVIASMLVARAIAQTPQTDSLPIYLTRYVMRMDSVGGWRLHPLTTFPYMKTRLHPWVICCSDKYIYIENVGRAVCDLGNATYYVGTTYQDSLGSIYLARQFRYSGRGWILLYEFVIITDKWDDPINVYQRRKGRANLEAYQ